MKTEKTQRMEDIITRMFSRFGSPESVGVNGLVGYKLIDCSYEDRTIAVSIDVNDNILNPCKAMHGGMICTVFDVALGALCTALTECPNYTPTIQMDVAFINPVPAGDRLLIEGTVSHLGRTLVHVSGKATTESNHVVCATCNAIFFAAGVKKCNG